MPQIEDPAPIAEALGAKFWAVLEEHRAGTPAEAWCHRMTAFAAVGGLLLVRESSSRSDAIRGAGLLGRQIVEHIDNYIGCPEGYASIIHGGGEG